MTTVNGKQVVYIVMTKGGFESKADSVYDTEELADARAEILRRDNKSWVFVEPWLVKKQERN